MNNHFDHINAHRAGVHLPYFAVRENSSHSPAVELYVDEDGQLLTRRDHFAEDDVMVCIRVQDDPVWVRVDHLGHRACDACINLWRIRSAEHCKVGVALFTRTTLPVTGEHALLHSNERPADNPPATGPLLRVSAMRSCGGSVRRTSNATGRQEALF